MNGKSYIGSSIDLEKRIINYFSVTSLERQLKKNSKSMISSSLLKYGYSAFSLEILEYCDPSVVISLNEASPYFVNFLFFFIFLVACNLKKNKEKKGRRERSNITWIY